MTRQQYTDRRPFPLYTTAQDTRCPACYLNEDHTIGQHNRAVAEFVRGEAAEAWEQDRLARNARTLGDVHPSHGRGGSPWLPIPGQGYLDMYERDLAAARAAAANYAEYAYGEATVAGRAAAFAARVTAQRTVLMDIHDGVQDDGSSKVDFSADPPIPLNDPWDMAAPLSARCPVCKAPPVQGHTIDCGRWS